MGGGVLGVLGSSNVVVRMMPPYIGTIVRAREPGRAKELGKRGFCGGKGGRNIHFCIWRGCAGGGWNAQRCGVIWRVSGRNREGMAEVRGAWFAGGQPTGVWTKWDSNSSTNGL